jgi:hypothetical protein
VLVSGFRMPTTGGLLLIQTTLLATCVTVAHVQPFAVTVALLRTVGSAALSTSAVLALFVKALSAALALTL